MRTSQRALLAVVAVPAVALTTAPVTQAHAGRHVGQRAAFAAPADGSSAFTYSPLVPVGARVKVDAWYLPDGRTVVVLKASGLTADYEYGAHAHASACGPTGAAAGPHFQFQVDPVAPSIDPAYANPDNEVWLDFTTDSQGRGWALAVQEWQPHADRRPGSVVLHIEHTHDGADGGAAGTAGARLACVSVGF